MSRLSIPAGLLVGVVVAALVLGGIVAFAPDPVPQPTASPIATVAPSAVIVASPVPSPSVSASPSPSAPASPSASPSPASSAESSSSAFHVGQPAPALVLSQVGGSTMDLSGVDVAP